MEIISRKEAKSLGLKRYFTGKACLNGHLVERRTSNGSCCACGRTPKEIEEMRVRSRLHYQVNRESHLLKGAEWRESNKGYRAKQYEDNKEKYKKMASEYRMRNIVMYQARDRNRRSRMAMAEGRHNRNDILAMLEKQKYKCANCKSCLKKCGHHVDHIQPLSRGGSNWPENLQGLCPTCNLKKNSKDPIVWAQENGRLL